MKKDKKKKTIIIYIAMVLVATVLYFGFNIFKIMYEFKMPKNYQIGNLNYTVPGGYLAGEYNDEIDIEKEYTYSRANPDSYCRIFIELDDPEIFQEEKKTFDGFLEYTNVADQIENFSAEMLKKEKINGEIWYTTFYDNTYYLIHYEGNKLDSNNFEIMYSILEDNSDDKICTKFYNDFKNSLKLKTK